MGGRYGHCSLCACMKFSKVDSLKKRNESGLVRWFSG